MTTFYRIAQLIAICATKPRIGLDIAKNICVLHAVNDHGKTVKRQTLSRSKVLSFFAQTEPCFVGIESCASSQYWAREMRQFGHTVKLMNPWFTIAYRKNGNQFASALLHKSILS